MDEILNGDKSMKYTGSEMLALSRGEDIDEFRKKQTITNEIRLASNVHVNMEPSKWPPLKFNWDFTDNGKRYCYDGLERDFDLPILKHGFARTLDIHDKLIILNKREIGNPWKFGLKEKLSYIIEYLHRELPISPIVIYPTNSNQIGIAGGNHRFTAAIESGLSEIAVYVQEADVSLINEIISIKWS